MKLLLTGASGFIGKEVTKLCVKSKLHVFALTRNYIEGCEHKVIPQLKDVKAEDMKGYDAIIHLAGIAHTKGATPNDYYNYNTELTIHLARIAAKANVKRFVFISTIGVNGKSTQGAPFCSSDSAEPHNDYAKSKLEAELGLKKVSLETGLEVVIIRPTLVYGASAPGNFGLLKKLVSALPILPFGLINNKRSFIFIKNLADLILLCTHHSKAAGETFLASDGKSVSIKHFTNELAKGLNKTRIQLPIPISLMRLFGKLTGRSEIVGQLVDDLEIYSSNTTKLLDWKPPYSLEQAMSCIKSDFID